MEASAPSMKASKQSVHICTGSCCLVAMHARFVEPPCGRIIFTVLLRVLLCMS
jgi:hypothetical protein